jgi:hypothetical protein
VTEDHRPIVRVVFLWMVIVSIPVIGMLLIGFMSYWTIPSSRVQLTGDPLIAYDPEIGFVPRPNSSSLRRDVGPEGATYLEYHLYTDRRGARVSRPGDQSPDRVEVVVVGDSFAWGHGVENQDTFAWRTIHTLGVTGANLAFGSYGTTQSLQMLRRNRDLGAALVILDITSDQPRRNILACAPSYYPFCLDYSRVAWNAQGQPYIAGPRTDGVRRIQLHVQSEKHGLDPLTWVVHGVDVAIAEVMARAAQMVATDNARQEAALEYLLGETARVAGGMKAALLIVYIPAEQAAPPPKMLALSASRFGYRFLDLSPAFASFAEIPGRPSLYLPNDGHPSAAAHALITDQLVSFIRRDNLLLR